MNYEYLEWLKNNPKNWSDATVMKYESAVRSISKDMLSRDVINKDLYSMTITELELAILLILKDEFFLHKDHVGNKMYSNGLKQYRTFMLTDYEQVSVDEALDNIEKTINNDSKLSVTEKQMIISARIGQGNFRDKLLKKYKKCLITGTDNVKLLIASHIKPWAISNNDERISVNNGLLLTPTFDKLFDIGFITFDKNGKLVVSSFVGSENEKRLYIPNGEVFELSKEKEFEQNMEYHRDILFLK